MALLTRRRVIAAKIETTPGTAEVLAGTDAAFNASNVQIQANIDFVQRPSQGGFPPLPGMLSQRGGQVTFDMEVATNGSGANAAWATTFLPGCGMVATTNTWAPASLPPGGAGFPKTLTIGVYEDGVRKVLAGCMGTVSFRLTDGEPIIASFTFNGVWQTPTDVAILTPTYPTTKPIRMMGASIVLASNALPPMQEFTFDVGNEVQMREDAANANGIRHAVIVGRRVNGTMNPEATLVATRPQYTEWLAETTGSFVLNAGSANNQITFSVPTWQAVNVQEAERNGLNIDQVEWQANRGGTADSDFTITFS